jgi:hypothetical protein
LDPRLRERVAALVRWHMWPPFFIQRGDYVRNAAIMSIISRCSELALLCRADARGRIGPDPEEALAAIDVFEQTCAEIRLSRSAVSVRERAQQIPVLPPARPQSAARSARRHAVHGHRAQWTSGEPARRTGASRTVNTGQRFALTRSGAERDRISQEVIAALLRR